MSSSMRSDTDGRRRDGRGGHRRRDAAALAVAIAAWGAQSLAAGAAAPNALLGPAPPARVGSLDARVAHAIRMGLDYLYSNQSPDGSWDNKYARQHPGGAEALVLLTALSAGEDPAAPPLVKAMKYLQAQSPRTVYVRAVRALALARLGTREALTELAEDVKWLGEVQDPSGGWGYGPGHRTTRDNPRWTDVSNTFLATLALRRAEEAGIASRPALWARCRRYWATVANSDGGISYQPPGGTGFRLRGSSYGSMTAAGIVALCLLGDAAAEEEPAFAPDRTDRAPTEIPLRGTIDRATKWLADNFAIDKNPRWVWVASEAYEYYYLYCLQNLADESGRAMIGSTDLAAAAAETVARLQRPNGSWRRPGADEADREEAQLSVINTCFALLTLTRARGPILLHKLRLDGDAGADARDAANLTRWIGRTFHWQAAWREAPLQTDDAALAQAPLLYVQTTLKSYGDALADKLRAFVSSGGTVLFQPFGAHKDAVAAATAFLRKTFPSLTARALDDKHPVFNTYFQLPPAGRPSVLGFGDAVRTRVLLLTSDVSGAWHQGRRMEQPQLFQFGANVLLYTTNLRRPPGRLAAAEPPPAPSPPPKRFVHFARIRHGGDWDIARAAGPRVGVALAKALSIGVKEMLPADLTQPVASSVPLLWLTGTRLPPLSDAQKDVLKKYLSSGGILLADSAMGGTEFYGAVLKMLTDMFGFGSVQGVPPDSPLLTGQFAGGIGADLTSVTYTNAAAARDGDKTPHLKGVFIDGRLAAVLSPYAVSVPAAEEAAFGCRGLSTADARRLAANAILFAAAQKAPR